MELAAAHGLHAYWQAIWQQAEEALETSRKGALEWKAAQREIAEGNQFDAQKLQRAEVELEYTAIELGSLRDQYELNAAIFTHSPHPNRAMRIASVLGRALENPELLDNPRSIPKDLQGDDQMPDERWQIMEAGFSWLFKAAEMPVENPRSLVEASYFGNYRVDPRWEDVLEAFGLRPSDDPAFQK